MILSEENWNATKRNEKPMKVTQLLLWTSYLLFLIGFTLTFIFVVLSFKTGFFVKFLQSQSAVPSDMDVHNNAVKKHKALLIWASWLGVIAFLVFFIVVYLENVK
jgi:hypothetical protein